MPLPWRLLLPSLASLRLPETEGSDSGNGACFGLSCNKVDILFVVDNSISMGSAQRGLNAGVPGVPNKITTQLEDTDFHLMVVDSDAAGYERTVPALCPTAEYDGAFNAGYPGICTGFPCASIAERNACDSTLGAGVVYPVGGKPRTVTATSPRDAGISRPKTRTWRSASCAAPPSAPSATETSNRSARCLRRSRWSAKGWLQRRVFA